MAALRFRNKLPDSAQPRTAAAGLALRIDRTQGAAAARLPEWRLSSMQETAMPSKSFARITGDVSTALTAMRNEVPDAMKGFSALAQAALKPGTIDAIHKELIALAIGVSSRCDACIGFHVKTLIRLGATREQLMETLAVCAYMGGGPTLMYAAEAVRAYDEFNAAAA
jgi:AhpD family alkylhydroperoxidase